MHAYFFSVRSFCRTDAELNSKVSLKKLAPYREQEKVRLLAFPYSNHHCYVCLVLQVCNSVLLTKILCRSGHRLGRNGN